jgi:integrase
LIAVYGGPRRSELEALHWEEHVNLDQGWLLLPGTKTKKSRRRVPIPESLRSELARNWQPSGPVVLPWLNARRDLRAACASRYPASDCQRLAKDLRLLAQTARRGLHGGRSPDGAHVFGNGRARLWPPQRQDASRSREHAPQT